uniref:Uncharacterized protein n=1 Tax=viral metagenome TaxID=1070528 RepID=A0A6M3KBN9_9ZZZZ
MKIKGTGLIYSFIKHRYNWELGERVLSISNAFPVRDILIISASGMWILEKVGVSAERALPYVAGYYVLSAIFRWLVGFMWTKKKGHDVETRFLADKVIPNRVVIINKDGSYVDFKKCVCHDS